MYIWIIVACILWIISWIVSTYLLSIDKSPISKDDVFNIYFGSFVISMAWPVVLALVPIGFVLEGTGRLFHWVLRRLGVKVDC